MRLMAPKKLVKKLMLLMTVINSSVHHSFTLAQNSQVIGSNDSTPAVPFNFEGFYLNTLQPATSNGTITTLKYCYYGRRDRSVNIYQSLVAVYRKGLRGNYDRISDTVLITKHRPSDTVLQTDVLLQGFNCDYLELNKNISVVVGDVIGACVYDTSNVEVLNLVSLTDNGGFLPVDSVHHADCDTGELPRRLVNDHLEATTRRVLLHLFAQIVQDGIGKDIDAYATTQPVTYTDEEYYSTEELPAAVAEEGQVSTVVISIVVTIGGLLLIAIIVLIIVVIVIAYCLAQKLKCSDSNKNVYTVASPMQDVVSIDDDTGSSSELSIQPSERQYDYIINNFILAERIREGVPNLDSVTSERNDCAVQENVAYTTNKSHPKIVKSPYHEDYVIFVS